MTPAVSRRESRSPLRSCVWSVSPKGPEVHRPFGPFSFAAHLVAPINGPYSLCTVRPSQPTIKRGELLPFKRMRIPEEEHRGRGPRSEEHTSELQSLRH